MRVLFGESPVAPGLKIANLHPILFAEVNAGHRVRDLSRDELTPAQRRFVVKQDAAAGEQVVRFPIVYSNPMAEQLGHGVRAARMEWCIFILRNSMNPAVELRA